MLNFELDLRSNLFINLLVYFDTMKRCSSMRLSFEEAMSEVRKKFPDLNEHQFFELRYEWQEFMGVMMEKPRPSRWEIENTPKVLAMLVARNEPEFSEPKFIQVMGRGMRMRPQP